MSAAENIDVSADTLQVCEFKIGQDFFGISVLNIQEIIKPQKITKVPLSDNYVKGLINLRGQIVTGLSLRTLFGLEEKSTEENMNVIVRHEDQLISFMVDKICDVQDLEKQDFQQTPDTISRKIAQYVSGVYKLEDRLLIILDINRLMNNNNDQQN
ncbi:MAG: chemotaxis protein CheW [Bdellovibrionaceae bacterium]|jgi:purine-binding chemotaxis protein CheW|nr:chemotaxis protein CheW [Pseudobdellovibrionaceae bacterium]